MEDADTQKELFEFEKPKKGFAGFGEMFRKAVCLENRFAVTLALEKLIFIAIGMLMLMVVIYALGVETGKAAAKMGIAPAVAQVKQPVLSLKPVQRVELKTSIPAKDLVVAAQPVQVSTPDAGAVKPYTIAAGSFRTRQAAVKETGRLKMEGFDAFIKESGSFFVVCVGAYPDKTSTQSRSALASIKQVRADAYFINK
jgi:hypothetical protein